MTDATAATTRGDHDIPPFRLDQAVSALAIAARAGLIEFCGDDDDRRLIAMGLFMQQLLAKVKQPQKMAGILIAVAYEVFPDPHSALESEAPSMFLALKAICDSDTIKNVCGWYPEIVQAREIVAEIEALKAASRKEPAPIGAPGEAANG